MISLFQKGGLFMYGILVISIFAFTLFFERATSLYLQLKLDTDKLYQKIIILLKKMNFREAMEECMKVEKHPLGRILKAGLLQAEKNEKDIERVMEEKILGEVPSIMARINYLVLLAIISILLGLIGTITNFINIFSIASTSPGLGQGFLLSKISASMLSTAFGLIVAIPCFLGYFILNNRGIYLINQCKEKALNLFNTLSYLKNDL